MRVWDLPPTVLCSKHLRAQHGEIHAIHSIISNQKKGFANHPEVRRWRPNLGALLTKHDETVAEMLDRGFNHRSPISGKRNTDMPVPIESRSHQFGTLQSKSYLIKHCDCADRILDSIFLEGNRTLLHDYDNENARIAS